MNLLISLMDSLECLGASGRSVSLVLALQTLSFFVGESTYDVVVNGSLASLSTPAAQDFSKYFYDVSGL